MNDTPQTDKKPFERKHLDTNDDKVDSRLNAEERAMLNDIKSWFRIDADSTALKLGLEVAHNVLQGTFKSSTLQYLSSPRRQRPGPR